jgi:hypothetical protein
MTPPKPKPKPSYLDRFKKSDILDPKEADPAKIFKWKSPKSKPIRKISTDQLSYFPNYEENQKFEIDQNSDFQPKQGLVFKLPQI